jgi:lysophospholipase L1-like esterase
VEWYEAEVAALEASLRERSVPPDPIVFYGSSSMRLWGSLAEDFPDLPVLNTAFGGSTLAACAWFFRRLVVPFQPRSLLIYAGDNDLGDGRSPEAVLTSLRDLLRQMDEALPGVRFGFLTIKPSPSRWHLIERIKAVNSLAEAELANRPGAFVIDVFGPMLGPDGQPRTELFAEDGLHLSAEGYRLWRGLVDGHRSRFI